MVAEINLIVFLFFRLFKKINSREQNFFDDKISFLCLCRNPDNVNRNLSDLATFQVMLVILERLSKK